MLTFFFDGVPETDSAFVDPGQQAQQSDSISLQGEMVLQEKPSHFIHYPYEEGECTVCHDSQSIGSMTEPQPGLCYLCHEDLAATYAYLHGPVAGGYCTSCHDPHSSKNEKLLRITGDNLCFHCHMETDVWKNEMHQGLDGMVCTDCHNPHGGEDKYIFQ